MGSPRELLHITDPETGFTISPQALLGMHYDAQSGRDTTFIQLIHEASEEDEKLALEATTFSFPQSV